MFWLRAAASANDPHAGRDELARIARHILRRAQVDVSAFHRSRNACIGLRRQRQGRGRAHAFDRIEHRDRTNAAITADDIRAPLCKLGREGLRVGAVETISVFVDGYLRNQRQMRSHVFRRQHGLMNLFQVPEGFEDQEVDTAFGQRCDLFAEGVACFLERSFAEGFDSGSERANRSCDPYIEAFGGIPSQPCAGAINVAYFVR
jgi:hypothetical protein